MCNASASSDAQGKLQSTKVWYRLSEKKRHQSKISESESYTVSCDTYYKVIGVLKSWWVIGYVMYVENS